jgi:hypothetical protein
MDPLMFLFSASQDTLTVARKKEKVSKRGKENKSRKRKI